MNALVGRLVAIGLVLMLAVVVPALSIYQIELVTQMLIYAIFAMSLDILLGYTGLPSLGHAAYFGLAAYATAILSLRLHVPFALAAPAGLRALARRFCAQGRARKRGTDAGTRIRRLAI